MLVARGRNRVSAARQVGRYRYRVLPILLTVLALFIWPLSAGATSPRLRPLPGSIGRLAFDETHAIWQDVRGLHVVRDGHPWGAATTFAPPRRCGTFEGAGGGSALYSCYPDAAGVVVPELLDLDTGGITTPPLDGLNRSRGSETRAVGVGARLIDILSGDSHGFGHSYLDRRTGNYFSAYSTARSVPSLDRADGLQPLCAPLRVRTHTEVDDDTGDERAIFDNVGYRPPYLVTWHDFGRLILERCHSRARTTLAKTAFSFKVTRDYIAWTTRRRFFIRRFAGGRTQSFKLPARGTTTVDGTRDTVVLRIRHSQWVVDLAPRGR